VGSHSAVQTPEPYFGLARLCGQKGDAREAMRLLATVQRLFDGEDIRVRAKAAEGMIMLDSGERHKAGMIARELTEFLRHSAFLPCLSLSMDIARLQFAVGARDDAADLVYDIARNNYDNAVLLAQCQEMFDNARRTDMGQELLADARKEASELMNQGLLLWKSGQLDKAINWMRAARRQMPQNVRFLLNYGSILLAYIAKFGADSRHLDEARKIVAEVELLSPAHPRCQEMAAQLDALRAGREAPMEQAA
jgi:predicted Zn-dependent protease